MTGSWSNGSGPRSRNTRSISYSKPRTVRVDPRPLPDVQVKIDLRRGDVGMTQVVLHDLQWDALVELPGGAGVTQGVAVGLVSGDLRLLEDARDIRCSVRLE
jgi:hypothetical protein